MLETPMDVLHQFPVRKTGKQKAAFRVALQSYAQRMGYSYREEKGHFGSRNLILGNPESASYLITAHYDTCAALPFPNLITPCNLFLFCLWQVALSAAIILLAVIAGTAAGMLTQDHPLGFWIGYLCFWMILVMIYVGPANRNNANDNTSGVVTVLEIARTLPENQRKKVCFVLFDLEEAGLIGSSCYRKKHTQEISRQLVLNFDCVGDGDCLMMFPTGRLKKDKNRMAVLETMVGKFGKKTLSIRKRGFSVYPSDQMCFPYGVGICALRKGRLGLYLSRIHTRRDTVLENTNVNILRAAITSGICCEAAKLERKKTYESI